MSSDKKQNKKTNSIPKAAALKYSGQDAPVLVAKGSGKTAEKILAIAKENKVHIHNDPTLLEVLSRLELGDEIPRALYLAVAKIIAFAYFLQGKAPEGFDGLKSSDDTHEARATTDANQLTAKRLQMVVEQNQRPALPPAQQKNDTKETN